MFFPLDGPASPRKSNRPNRAVIDRSEDLIYWDRVRTAMFETRHCMSKDSPGVLFIGVDYIVSGADVFDRRQQMR